MMIRSVCGKREEMRSGEDDNMDDDDDDEDAKTPSKWTVKSLLPPLRGGDGRDEIRRSEMDGGIMALSWSSS